MVYLNDVQTPEWKRSL